MSRFAKSPSISDIIEEAVREVVEHASAAIAEAVRRARQEQEQQRRAAARHARRSGGSRRKARPGRTRRRAEEMTRWLADRRARRVPNFVIEATGLDTKKKIIARFGENAAFEKGKPLPEVRPARVVQRPRRLKARQSLATVPPAPENAAPPVVKARPPIIRKGAARVG